MQIHGPRHSDELNPVYRKRYWKDRPLSTQRHVSDATVLGSLDALPWSPEAPWTHFSGNLETTMHWTKLRNFMGIPPMLYPDVAQEHGMRSPSLAMTWDMMEDSTSNLHSNIYVLWGWCNLHNVATDVNCESNWKIWKRESFLTISARKQNLRAFLPE